jgi:hypothetical protein
VNAPNALLAVTAAVLLALAVWVASEAALALWRGRPAATADAKAAG